MLGVVGQVDHIVQTLMNQITNGTLFVGAMLPPQRELAREFGVSRDTVQRALRELQSEGYIESRQGSGSRVLRPFDDALQQRRPMPLGGVISAAFESGAVTVDVFALTGEVLDAQLRVSAEKVRMDSLRVESINVRMLLPTIDRDFRLLATPTNRARDRHPLDRLLQLREQYTFSINNVLRELERSGLVRSVSFESREVSVVPMQKLYLVNASEVVTGFYQVVQRRLLLDTEEEVEVYDVLGLGATLHHHSAAGDNPDPASVTIVTRARRWYEHMWSTADSS